MKFYVYSYTNEAGQPAADVFTKDCCRDGEKFVFNVPDIIIAGRAGSWPGYTVERVIDEFKETYRTAVLNLKGKGENGNCERFSFGRGVAPVVSDLLSSSDNKKAPTDPTIRRGQ